ncbi:MAG: sugar phosphate isomerase/epimerase [Spirochaetales bacterium]|nr:sugar phosphate isomerase/epimerase [Spirochaetales bacterium]
MNRYPFFPGTTSFIYHADILTNVEKLASRVDDIELVLFVAEKEDNLPSSDCLDNIKEIAGANNMGFTVHLPLRLSLGNTDEADRVSSVTLAAKIIRLTACISPRAYIIHLNENEPCKENADKARTVWTDLCSTSLHDIVSQAGTGGYLCIENLEGYDITHLDPFLQIPDIHLCLDIGHLWVQGENPVRIIEQYAKNIRVIHLHGIHERDHRSLAFMDFDKVKRVLDAIRAHHFSGVLTLEVFNEDDLHTSLQVLDKWADERGIER